MVGGPIPPSRTAMSMANMLCEDEQANIFACAGNRTAEPCLFSRINRRAGVQPEPSGDEVRGEEDSPVPHNKKRSDYIVCGQKVLGSTFVGESEPD